MKIVKFIPSLPLILLGLIPVTSVCTMEPAKFLTTLPQLLKANGYNTLAASKIFHHGRGSRPEVDSQSDPTRQLAK